MRGLPLEVRGLGVVAGDARLLDAVTAAAPGGAVTVLAGPSGAGKSTLLQAIAGLRPHEGHVVLGDVRLDGRPPEGRGVGLVFQHGRLFPFLDVAGNVAFGLRGRGRAEAERRVDRVLALCRAEHLRDRAIDSLSGGERQRVALARALAPEPGVLLLDEPWSALDATLRLEVATDLLRAVRGSGTTAVVVTHDRVEALTLADHLWLIDRGRLLQQGTPEACYRHPATVEAARLLGEVMAWPLDPDGTIGGQPVPRVLRDVRGVRHAVLRPEDLEPVTTGGFRAEVAGASFLGDRWRIYGTIHGRPATWYGEKPRGKHQNLILHTE